MRLPCESPPLPRRRSRRMSVHLPATRPARVPSAWLPHEPRPRRGVEHYWWEWAAWQASCSSCLAPTPYVIGIPPAKSEKIGNQTDTDPAVPFRHRVQKRTSCALLYRRRPAGCSAGVSPAPFPSVTVSRNAHRAVVRVRSSSFILEGQHSPFRVLPVQIGSTHSGTRVTPTSPAMVWQPMLCVPPACAVFSPLVRGSRCSYLDEHRKGSAVSAAWSTAGPACCSVTNAGSRAPRADNLQHETCNLRLSADRPGFARRLSVARRSVYVSNRP